MAWTRKLSVVFESVDQIVIHVAGIQDAVAADEADIVLIDKSTLVDRTGAEPDALDLEWVRWCMQGVNSIRLEWDRTSDTLMLALSGNGFDDFMGAPDIRGFNNAGGLKDPREAGATGDILLSTQGGAANGTYDLTLWFRKSHV